MKKMFKIIALKLFVIVGFASIYDGKHWYRVTGFYYRYQYNNGRLSDPKCCHRIFANAIGGYGISGWYPLIEDVVDFRLEFRKARWYFFMENLKHIWWSLLNPQHSQSKWFRYKIGYQVANTPKGFSEQEYENYIIKKAISKAIRKLP